MTEIFVDNEIYQPSPSPSSSYTIGELVEKIRDSFSGDRRVIVSISRDREEVPEDQIGQVLGQPHGTYQRLDFATVSLDELAGSALQAALQLLHDSRPLQQKVVEMLAKDNMEEAVRVLVDCVTCWMQAHDSVVKTVQLLNVNISDMSYEGSKVVDIFNQVADQLKQLKECLAARDYVLLNDLLQYEVLPTFNRWEGTVATILDRISIAPTAS